MLAVTLMFMSMLATRCQLQCIEFTDDSLGHYIFSAETVEMADAICICNGGETFLTWMERRFALISKRSFLGTKGETKL